MIFLSVFQHVQSFACLNFLQWKSIAFMYLAQPKKIMQSRDKKPNCKLRYIICYKQLLQSSVHHTAKQHAIKNMELLLPCTKLGYSHDKTSQNDHVPNKMRPFCVPQHGSCHHLYHIYYRSVLKCSKFPVDAGFLCDKAVIFRDTTERTPAV
jgi:hypothetical protein